MNFTKSQEDAIRHTEGNLQLVACAGSGKTEVVARRVANLLKKPPDGGGCVPANIVAFTFTEKAAAELKERIVARCREESGEIPGLAEMFVGTIHAFCLELLKAEVPQFLKYEVLNEVQQAILIDRFSKKSGLTESVDLAGKALRRYVDTNSYVAALGILREAEPVDQVLRGNSVVAGLRKYQELLRGHSYFDYSAIMEEAVRALTNETSLRDRLAIRVRHVIVDEYQDVNPIQERVVRILHELGASICVVGDDDQTIYQWRGSAVRNILEFSKRYSNVTPVRLQENFRSSEGIVETARVFIAQNAERLEKQMIPTGAHPYEPGDIMALAFSDQDAEAAHIAKTIQSLRGVAIKDSGRERGISWSDMAILFRRKTDFAPVTRALAAARVPYVVAGMNNLFETPEAEAARQLFYFLANRDGVTETVLDAAWGRAAVGVASADLKRAIAAAAVAKRGLHEGDESRWNVYSLQRQFLSFLEDMGIREETVPNGRGEVVFYNLGKFSQLISDFEEIHYKSNPLQKYKSFDGFLEYRAEDAYPEGWQDNAYANPDAVRIMTIHQAKGMQWPVVFVPALLKNRFPGRKPGGRTVWHLLPRDGILDQSRYEGTIEDERRLFYVAMTRSQKFLHLTWGAIPGNKQAQKVSEFWEDVLVSKWVKRGKAPDYTDRRRLAPTPKASVANVVFSFSDIKYFFECPYQFKLRILYGFNLPIHEALGYGKSLHDALADVHARAIRKERISLADVPYLVQTHLHTPYAYPALRAELEKAARGAIADYIKDNQAVFDKIEFSEKTIEINLGGGVSVVGRIDLVRRIDTGETTIVDLKSTDRAQAEEVTETQLHVYALGYQELTGRRADYVEIYNLDKRQRKPRAVDDDFIADVKTCVQAAADALRQGTMMKAPAEKKCSTCDYRRMCSEGARLQASRRQHG
jgi:DNA helicase-2/ATP-dependent DNA helicase PcrA